MTGPSRYILTVFHDVFQARRSSSRCGRPALCLKRTFPAFFHVSVFKSDVFDSLVSFQTALVCVHYGLDQTQFIIFTDILLWVCVVLIHAAIVLHRSRCKGYPKLGSGSFRHAMQKWSLVSNSVSIVFLLSSLAIY